MIHVSPKHRIVGVPAAPQIINLFPHAKVFDMDGFGEMALLPHGRQETIMLKNLGFDVPAPILSQYEWPAPLGQPPFAVQKFTAALMSMNQRCYVLNGMGTGKTRSALWAYDYLRGNKQANKLLVNSPISTMELVWRAEAFRTLPHLSVGVLYGSKERRLKTLAEDHDIYVLNPDGLQVILPALLERKDIDTWIVDELAEYRNAGSMRNKLAKKLAERMTWVWGMTGSPTPQDPTDAFGQCKLITPHTVPKYFGQFRDQTMLKVSAFKYAPKKEATQTVYDVMKPAVRYTLEDVTELPPIIERTVDVEMGPQQKKVYEEIRKYAFSAVANNEITAVNAGAVLNKLLQSSLGYVYSNSRGVVGLDNDVRLDALADAVNATDRKVLVFVPYTHALMGVHERLVKEKIDVAPPIWGDTPKRVRDNVFTCFQNTSKYKVIPAHPKCMSHGLTLTAADTVIWFGPHTSLETFEQANARVRRIGQKFKQLILMLQGSPVEKKMYARLRAKQRVQDNILDLFAQNTEVAL